jgi:hypothetical protein
LELQRWLIEWEIKPRQNQLWLKLCLVFRFCWNFRIIRTSLQLSRDFGYPVMLKATAGGGEKEWELFEELLSLGRRVKNRLQPLEMMVCT